MTRHHFDGGVVSDGAKLDAGEGGSGGKIGSSGIEGDGSAFFVTDSGFFLLPVTGAFRSSRIRPHEVADRTFEDFSRHGDGERADAGANPAMAKPIVHSGHVFFG